MPVTPAPARCRGVPDAPGQVPHPPLLRALVRRDFDEALVALELDAEAAQFPFWDHGVEPPLVAAVRLGCPAPILALLLENGANVKALDAKGQTALDVANACDSPVGADIKTLLVDAGVVETLPPSARVIQTFGDFPFKDMSWSDVEALDPFSEGGFCAPPTM